MSYTLEAFTADCRRALEADSGAAGLEQVRQWVQKALKDEHFKETYLGAATQEREVIYEDPTLGFCVCVHVYGGAKDGFPHDHGPTWAIYGQAQGETAMTDWQIVTPPMESKPGIVEKVRTYTLKPGDAHIYEVGDVHAPYRKGPTKLLRIEGRNTDQVKRTPLEAR